MVTATVNPSGTWSSHASGPLATVDVLTLGHLLSTASEPARPCFVDSPLLNATLTALGLTGLEGLRDSFGDGFISLSEDPSGIMSEAQGRTDLELVVIRDWVDSVRRYERELSSFSGEAGEAGEPIREPGRPSEWGGEHFFFSRPEIYAAVGAACAQLLPEGYRAALLANVSSLRVHGLPVVLWAAAQQSGYTQLHQDFVPGSLLWHLEGRKRVHLYAPEDAGNLYMSQPLDGDDNWDSYSQLPSDGTRSWEELSPTEQRAFPRFERARPTVIDLEPGRGLWIPCGWPHWVEYIGTAMSVGCVAYPDWLPDLVREDDEWSPQSCAAFHD